MRLFSDKSHVVIVLGTIWIVLFASPWQLGRTTVMFPIIIGTTPSLLPTPCLQSSERPNTGLLHKRFVEDTTLVSMCTFVFTCFACQLMRLKLHPCIFIGCKSTYFLIKISKCEFISNVIFCIHVIVSLVGVFKKVCN